MGLVIGCRMLVEPYLGRSYMLRETSQEKALRLAASGPREECRRVRERIRRDHVRTGHDPDGRPPRLERLVAYVEEHLFEASLSVLGACEAVGIGNRNMAAELRAYTGYTTDELIDKLRIDTAVGLVVATRIKITSIGHLLGFKAYSTFLRTYKHWAGETPRDTRDRHGIDPAADIPFDFGNWRLVRRIGEGALTPEELRRFHDRIAELYPDELGEREDSAPETATVVVPAVMDAEAFERFQAAEVIWPKLVELPFTEQRELVRGCPFWTPAFFDFLHRKSREEGRRCHQRGIEVSQLVLDSLDASEARLGERVHELRVEGWSWLGNARRLDLDFGGAEAPFHRAEALLDANNLRDSRAAGIFYLCKGTLRMFQRRHVEAIGLYDYSLPALEQAGDVRFQIQSLLHRAAALRYDQRFEEATSTLRKAKALLKGETAEELTFWVNHDTIVALTRAGDFHLAKAHLKSIAQEVSRLPIPLWGYQVQWLKAVIDHGLERTESAEADYLSSWHGFQALGEPLYAALVMLDLAILYSEAGKIDRVIEIATTIFHVFDSLKLNDETVACIKLFREAITQTRVTSTLLARVRFLLWCDPLVALQ